MRKILWFFAMLIAIAASAEAQVTSATGPPTSAEASPGGKHWDLAGSAAFFNVQPGGTQSTFGERWYSSGRYAAAIGYYWTEHLKSEAEYAIGGEGSLYTQELRTGPGLQGPYPVSMQTFHRLEQYSARMLWQFGSNSWVHPYVSGGLVVDRERQRVFIPAQYQ